MNQIKTLHFYKNYFTVECFEIQRDINDLNLQRKAKDIIHNIA